MVGEPFRSLRYRTTETSVTAIFERRQSIRNLGESMHMEQNQCTAARAGLSTRNWTMQIPSVVPERLTAKRSRFPDPKIQNRWAGSDEAVPLFAVTALTVSWSVVARECLALRGSSELSLRIMSMASCQLMGRRIRR